MKKISIILATYNGREYIAEQLNSLLESDGFFELVDEVIISDDNSTDRIIEVINDYCSNYPMIKCISNTSSPGVVNNFMNGVRAAKNDFIMFCDQDDVWLPNKIKTMHKSMMAMDAEYSQNIPLLAFSDLYIVDEKLNIICSSFMDFHNINMKEALATERLILNNVSPGCVTIVNRKLIELAQIDTARNWVMHDWWFMLLASSLGKIAYVDKPLMLYRQHENNVVGSNRKSILQKLLRLPAVIVEYNKCLSNRRKQAAQLLFVLKSMNCKSGKIKNIERIIEHNVYTAKYECSKKRMLLALLSYNR